MALDLKSFAIGKANGSGGGDVEVKPLTVTANGIYSDLGNVAYKPVRVQVPTPTLEDVTITQNGITEAIEGKAFKKVTVEVPTYPEPTGSINITENGTYNVKDKAEAVVDVQGGESKNPYEIVNAIMDRSIVYFKTDASGQCPIWAGDNAANRTYEHLVFLSFRNAKTFTSYINIQTRNFMNSVNLIYANLGITHRITDFDFSLNSSLTALILPLNAIVVLSNVNAFNKSLIASGSGFVWVPTSLADTYKTTTNWSTYANQIKAFAEAPIYDNSTTYEIGDVCQFNGKFYGYCKEDLTSSVGNAPSGTTEDNAYWEYVDDIEV